MKSVDERLRLEGERRQVTVLFYDVVGSTEILLRGDPEHYFHSVTALHRTAEKVIGRFGGFHYQKLGDGGCCYFGYPEQSEDAAENAVDAALELLRGTARRTGRGKSPFSLRIGIATGLVVFSAARDEIVGMAPVLASRLQAEAEPNTILVSDATFALTRGKFIYQQMGKVDLKGFSDPSTLWRPEARRPLPSPRPRNSGRAMVGRAAELACLSTAWQAAGIGKGRAFTITGEAGIGKSRLALEFLGGIPGKARVLQCDRRFEGQPLHPFLGFLESVVPAAVMKGPDPGAIGDALRAAGLEADPETIAPIRTFVTERSGPTARNIRVSDLSGSQLRGRVIDAAIRILGSAAEGPALVVVEDIHWADEMTLELLDRLGAQAAERPILLVATSRLPRDGPGMTQLPLSGLSQPEMRDLVRAIWNREPPAGLADFILERCDGMPLYAEELTAFLQARDAPGEQDWRSLLAEGGVSSLNDLLSSRLASAGAARELAQLASAIGREFTASLLAKLIEPPERKTLGARLDSLVALGIIAPASQAETFQFRHALLQEAAYASLLRSDRRRIHERIADLLVGQAVPPLPAALAAWQCAEAGRHIDAVRFALSAAEACVLRSAMKEASLSLDLCSREITRLASRHPDRRESQLTMLQLQAVVATALEGEGSDKARRIYSRTMQLARRHPPAAREGHFPAYWGWWFTAPNTRTQQARARVLVEDMRTVNDAEVRMQSFHCAWATSFHAGEHGYCLDCVSRGLELYDPERAVRNRAFFGGHDAKICGLGESALSHLLIGQSAASEDAIARSLDYAAAIDHVGSLVHALYYALVLRHCQGRHDEVVRLGERMLDLAECHGLAASQARARMYCGWAELMGTNAQAGARRFREAFALHQRAGTDDNLTIHSDMQAQVLARTGHPREALAILDGAITLGRKSGQRFWLAELYRRRARLRQDLGEPGSAVSRDLGQAVRIAEAQGAHWLLGRARRDLAAWRDEGKASRC